MGHLLLRNAFAGLILVLLSKGKLEGGTQVMRWWIFPAAPLFLTLFVFPQMFVEENTNDDEERGGGGGGGGGGSTCRWIAWMHREVVCTRARSARQARARECSATLTLERPDLVAQSRHRVMDAKTRYSRRIVLPSTFHSPLWICLYTWLEWDCIPTRTTHFGVHVCLWWWWGLWSACVVQVFMMQWDSTEAPFFLWNKGGEKKVGKDRQSGGPVGSSVSRLAGQAFISSFITGIKHIDFSSHKDTFICSEIPPA